MLLDMYRYVFSSLLVVSFAAPALAHDEKGACDADHAQAARASGAASVKPGGVLVRGEPLPKNQAPLPLSVVLSKPDDGRQVLVEGVVRRACSQMGCWMELAPAEGGPGLRVTFKDYGFFVPTDSAGAKARVQGTLKVAQLTAAQADHLRAEGGSMAAGAQREVRLIASGVELRR
jgi:3-oxoacyl-(acyl-carrier-protein) synthase